MVCTTWLYRPNEFYLLDVFRARLDFPTLERTILAQAERFQANLVLIESVGAGEALVQRLRETRRINVVPHRPQTDKVSRMKGESARIEAGQVLLPKEAPWLADFQHEMVHFPKGKYDDQVDSLSQFLYWVRKRSPEANRIELRVTGISSTPTLSVDDLFRMRWR